MVDEKHAQEKISVGNCADWYLAQEWIFGGGESIFQQYQETKH